MPRLKDTQDNVTKKQEQLIQTEGGQSDGETSEYLNIFVS